MTDEELIRLLRAHAFISDGDWRAEQLARDQAEAERAEAHRDSASLRTFFELLTEPLAVHLGLNPELTSVFRVFLYLRATELMRGESIADHIEEWCDAFAAAQACSRIAKVTPELILLLLRDAVLRRDLATDPTTQSQAARQLEHTFWGR